LRCDWRSEREFDLSLGSHRSRQRLDVLNGGTVKKTHWTPAPNGAQRGQIAQFGHPQAGQSVAMTDTAVNGMNQCIANVQIYLALQEQAGVTR
jgi:hypothetical protein